MNDPHAKLANPHLSIFRPYTGNPRHEDQLTRAALIVMKFVPRAQDAMLAMIGCSPLSKLPAPRFDLQTEKLVPPGDGDGNVDKLVSVFLTPDEHVAGFDKIEASERRARYDGVIQYGSKLLVVVESKLFDVGKHAGGRTPAEIADKGFRQWLLNRHYATNEDLIGLNKWISARPAGLQIHVRPSVQIQRIWKLATAVELDRENHFADDVKHAIESMLAALDEPPLGTLAQVIPNPESSTVVDS